MLKIMQTMRPMHLAKLDKIFLLKFLGKENSCQTGSKLQLKINFRFKICHGKIQNVQYQFSYGKSVTCICDGTKVSDINTLVDSL